MTGRWDRDELHGACERRRLPGRGREEEEEEGGRNERREEEGAKRDESIDRKWKMTFWTRVRRRRTQEAAAELTARRNTQDLWEKQQGRKDGNEGGDVRTSSGTRGAPGRMGTEGTRHATTSDTWSDNETRSETKQRMFQLTNRVSRFRRQVERLGTTKDTSQLRQKIKEDRESISEEAKELAEVLKQNSRETSASATRSERAAQERLLEDLKGVLREFQEAQLTRVHKESSTVPVDEENASNLSTWYEGQADPREQDDPMYQDLEEQALLQQQQKARKEELDSQIRHNEAIIQERDRGIQEIQNEIGEVNEIFADLAVLVQQQGGMIDDIEANVVSAAGRTGEAVVELRKAERNQRKSRGRLCIVMMIFGLVLLVVIITAHR